MYKILIADELGQCFVIEALPVQHVPSHLLLHRLAVIVGHSLCVLVHNFIVFKVFSAVAQNLEIWYFLVSSSAQGVKIGFCTGDEILITNGNLS